MTQPRDKNVTAKKALPPSLDITSILKYIVRVNPVFLYNTILNDIMIVIYVLTLIEIKVI